MAARIDVSIEHKHAPPPEPDGKRHPNTCPACGSHYRQDELEQHLNVCPHCGHHFPLRARARIAQLADAQSFSEEAADLRSDDLLGFFDLRPYTERLAGAEMSTGLGEAMVIGQATLDGKGVELAVMDFAFMGGSMGRVVGEKFTRACESAAERQIPLVSVTASGVLASFASLGDVIVAEPGALLSFTGPRVVQQTTREKLPDDFGLAESNFRHGHVDAIVPRPELRPTLARLLRLFANGR